MTAKTHAIYYASTDRHFYVNEPYKGILDRFDAQVSFMRRNTTKRWTAYSFLILVTPENAADFKKAWDDMIAVRMLATKRKTNGKAQRRA